LYVQGGHGGSSRTHPALQEPVRGCQTTEERRQRPYACLFAEVGRAAAAAAAAAVAASQCAQSSSHFTWSERWSGSASVAATFVASDLRDVSPVLGDDAFTQHGVVAVGVGAAAAEGPGHLLLLLLETVVLVVGCEWEGTVFLK